MCGIVGYIGFRSAAQICLEGLHRLEYRGYDSAGIAVVHDGGLDVRKVVGKLCNMDACLADSVLPGGIGIGHTRWATHGRPSVENCHPHLSANGRIAVVHNGIIENYGELRERLQAEGFTFNSQTDTEVMANLVQKYYAGDLRAAVVRAVQDLQGAFAFGIIAADSPGELVAVRRFSPLVVGLGDGENYIASDMGAIRKETDRVLVIDDDEVALVTREGVELTGLDGSPLKREVFTIPWPADGAEKGGHKKFMHKEIHEQPDAMRACLAGRLSDAEEPVQLDGLTMTDEEIRSLERVVFTACGTAYHAGMVGRFLMETLARIPADCDLAAELRARNPVVLDNTLCVPISQSGETADTLVALRDMRAKGARCVSVLNVVDSSIARESDGVIYIQAGPEIGVASTKAYTSQVMTVILMALHFAEVRGTADPALLRELKAALLEVPERVRHLLDREPEVQEVATRFHRLENALFLGRGVSMPSALEGALKLKEISYIHAEGCSAGEMKHGPIAMIDPEFFTVAIALHGDVYEKMIGNIHEIKARSGPVIGVVEDGDTVIAALCDALLWVPPVPELISPLTTAIPLQLFAYHMADLRGEDIDQPRNLAKTVTVE